MKLEDYPVVYAPRSDNDKRPWQLQCKQEPPEWAYYEQGWQCYCRRFRNQRQAESWITRRILGKPYPPE